MTRLTKGLQAAALALAAATTACSVGSADTIHAEMSDRYPSTTAAEWVTYADFVAVVQVADDQRAEPAQEARERGEGSIDRIVKFRVNEVLWRDAGTREPPGTIAYPALGWEFRDGNVDDAAQVVADDRPRFERGHSYVVALTWQPPRCYEGDGQIPGRWLGLGAGSSIPYDGALGAGEFAGEDRSLEDAEAYAEDLPAGSVVAQVTGEDLAVLREILESAKAGPKGDYGPAPSDC